MTKYKKIVLDEAVGGGEAIEITEEDKTTVSKAALLEEKQRIEGLLAKFNE